MADAAVLAAIRAGEAPVWVAELVIDGTTYKIGTSSFYPSDGGHYEERIKSVEDISFRISDAEGTMGSLSTTITIRDDDRWWRSLVGGGAHDVEFSPVSIWMAWRSVSDSSKWVPVLLDAELRSWSFPSSETATLSVRVADRALESKRPRTAWKLTTQDWPDLDGAAQNKYAPWIYGEHDSALTTRKGIIPLYRVATTTFLVCAGKASEITNVYVDGALQLAADWSTTYPVKNGKQFTCVEFDSDPGETVDVTVDMHGYEDVGDGTGTLIDSQPAIIAHLLSNAFFGDYRLGPWLATCSCLDSSLTGETRWDDYGHAGSYYFGDLSSGYDVIGEWCASTGAELWWWSDGKIHLSVDDPTYTWTDYPAPTDAGVIRWDKHRMGEFSLMYSDALPPTSIRGEYFWDEVEGSYSESVSVENPIVEDDAPEEIQLPFSGAS